MKRNSNWTWARDVLLTFFVPPLGLAFTGPELFSPRRREAFSRSEVWVIAGLFVIGVLLTFVWTTALTMTSTFTESGG